jgi:type IV fimbrial biogenesis protein FimT
MNKTLAIMRTPTAAALTRARSSGFTLIELMIAFAVLAILVRVAAPSVRDVTLNARMSAQVSNLLVDIATARSEAVHRSSRVAMCTSSNGTACTGTAWDQGWMLFVDTNLDGSLSAGESILKVSPALQPGNSLEVSGDSAGGAGRYVPYWPSGVISPNAAVTVTFRMCDHRTTANVGASATNNKGRLVTINNTGRPVVSRITCS